MRAILLLLTWSMAGLQAYAQVRGLPAARAYSEDERTTSRNTGFGLKGGFSRGDLQSSSSVLFYSGFDYLPTFNAGVYGQVGFTHFASLQAELLYARTGFRGYNGGINGTGPPTDNRLDYLALPVLFVGNITETLSVHLGPQAAVLLAAHNGPQSLDLSGSGFRRFDLGGVLGAEARLGIARLGVRYTYSLPVLNPTGAAVTEAGTPVQVLAAGNDYHNLVLQAYLGLGLAH